MKIRLTAASWFVGVLATSASAQVGIQSLGASPARSGPAGGGTQNLTAGRGTDGCAAPDPIAGPGPFLFDNVGATTGAQGQGEGACFAFGTSAIDNDVWFTWTSPSTGIVTLTLCGLTVFLDTKVAVYDGAGCPTAPAIACNDDFCGLISQLAFNANRGHSYTIQLGNYPGAAPGLGAFSMAFPPPATACSYDDGTTETGIGLIGGGEIIWLQMFGGVGFTTTVYSVSTAYGDPTLPGGAPVDGTPSRIAIWDDPNDDGDPTDAVLLQIVQATVENVDTDILSAVAFTPPVLVSGVYFIGAGTIGFGAAAFAAPQDTLVMSLGRAWAAGNAGGAANYADLTANSDPPVEMDTIALPGVWRLRADCEALPEVVPYCFPGVGPVMLCPCGNPPAGGGAGCDNFGAGPVASCTLSAAGQASLTTDDLVFTSTDENFTSTTIFMQGTAKIAGGVAFGAGVRCVGGALKRLYAGNAAGGAISRPGGADLDVHTRSAALGDVILPGQARYYMTYYRDPAAAGPCGSAAATFNSGQALMIAWSM